MASVPRVRLLLIVCISYQYFWTVSEEITELDTVTVEDIENITKESCLLAGLFSSTSFNVSLAEILNELRIAFKNEQKVRIAMLSRDRDFLKSFRWKDNVTPSLLNDCVVFFARRKLDRTCLTQKPKLIPAGEVLSGNIDAQLLLLFINSKCETFQTLDGKLSKRGKRRVAILGNLYHLPEVPFPKIAALCERIKMPSKLEFLQQYLFRSKPVVIEGAIDHWPAIKKWTNRFLEANFGKNDVHIKLTSDGVFEGCDKARHFANFKSFRIPKFVAEQLPFPELVVVRPASTNLNFSSFLEMIERPQKVNISAYLEYSSIPDYMPELEDDIEELDFVKGLLTRKYLNIWLSNGNTLGKLHFDPFENFLCQISGSKQLILFEPHNNDRLYEGHIQEAILNFDKVSKKFSKEKLLDSTSMVMSPIDILQPDYESFPRFKGTSAMKCTIHEGDVLYMPSFWWHEVQSVPSKEKRNLAVNFWYEPFLVKEFPCAECPMDVNSHYYHNLL